MGYNDKDTTRQELQVDVVEPRHHLRNGLPHGNNSTAHHIHHAEEHHKTCAGGSAAACACMLDCEVFGGAPMRCVGKSHVEKKMLVDGLIGKTMVDHHDMCKGMECIMRCASKLGCLDEKVRKDCETVYDNYTHHRSRGEPA